MHWIDLNCDAGEGVGNEPELFPFISSCSIACGGHAGDETSMEATIRLARQHGVKVGAHPAYPDREHFGRITMSIGRKDLQYSLENQLKGFMAVMRALDAPLHHIKAHGALYNDLATGGSLAESYLEVLEPYRQEAVLYVPCGSSFIGMAASRGFTIWEEGFADRAYEPDGSLVSRTRPGAVLTAPQTVFNQLREMVIGRRVKASNGSWISMEPRTYCLHGDTPNAVQILEYLKTALPGALINIQNE
jgi:UPF0271 protein